jgi:glycosyltransferase involved in cell wall biosynthesis
MTKIKAGDWVEVRSKEEILATLDKQGRLDGMPFMPQMFEYCGKCFQVYKRAHKTCDTIVYNWDSPGRLLGDGIHLNLRCDGKAYGGCQASCLIFWKEAWLKPVESVAKSAEVEPFKISLETGCAENYVLRGTRAEDVRGCGEPRYACQATQLLEFTRPLPWWDARQYVEDYTSGNATLGQILRGLLWSVYYNVTLARSSKLGAPARYIYDRFQALWGGLPYPRHHGLIPAGQPTPTATLDLQPGELVRIKSYEEILATLDTRNKNAGMTFDGEQVPYCGRLFRVRGRVETFIDEQTGYLKKMRTPAVILEGVFCRSRYSDCRLYCPRSIFSWWREVWLERVVEGPQPQIREAEEIMAPVDLVAMAAKAPERQRVPILHSTTPVAVGSHTSSSTPLFTIAIPTYNRADLMESCVTSALAQTYHDIEVLVSDNASTDDTVSRLKAFGDERLRVLTSDENIGATGNFNKCVREARGEYLVLAADDNTFEPHFVEKCAKLLKTEPNLPIVLSAYDVLILNEFSSNDRRSVPARLSKRLSTGIWQGTDILRDYLNGRLSAQLLSSAIRTDILRRNGYSMHPCAADEATWIPALLEGRAGLINERCATYMVHGSSLSDRFTADERFGDLCQVMEEIADLAEKTIPDPTTRRQIQRLTMRYVAYIAMINLVIYRRAGASLTDIAQKLWSWRALIRRCTITDFTTTLRLRSLGRILLPSPVSRWSVRLGLDRLL